MTPGEDRRAARQRVAKILALGLLWGIGVLALVVERAPTHRRAPAPAAARTTAATRDDLVDIARVQLHKCRIDAIAFRTRTEGWVTNACGEAFRTADGGVTFKQLPFGDDTLAMTENPDESLVGEVNRIEWLSERRGVAFANDRGLGGPITMLSTDGGVRWRRGTLPTPPEKLEMIYSSDHVGQTVWACGVSGAISRSRNGGYGFALTRHTPFNSSDRCMALSFVDEHLGWAGGTDGTLYATVDGGDSWARLRVPRRAARWAETRPADWHVAGLRLIGVARLSATDGWIAMRDDAHATRTFFTTDGGQTWNERKPPVAIEAKLAGGSVVGDLAVFERGGRLAIYAGGELVRETPLVGHGPVPAPETLRGREPLEAGHVAAWTDHAVVETFDDGRSWSTVVRVGDDERIRRVVHPALREDPLRVLIELVDGRIVGGWRELLPSTQPEFDRFVIARVEAQRRGAPAPGGPLDCLATATTGHIDIHHGVQGCEFSREADVHFTWDASGATLTMSDLASSKPIAIDARARREFAAAVAAAVQAPDDGNQGCTTSLFMDLKWQCGAGTPGSASFSESHCGDPKGPAHRAEDALRRLLPDGTAGRIR